MKNYSLKYIVVLGILFQFNSNCQVDSIPSSHNIDFDFNAPGESIANLPLHIPIQQNIAYLYADFENVKEYFRNSNKTYIPVYLINNSNEIITIDGYEEPELQQVYEIADDIWIRTQPYYYGWCGTEYLSGVKIRSGEYYCFYENFLTKGDEKKVRYTFVNKNIALSNAGLGKVNKDDVEKAKYDDIALNIEDFEFLKKIATGEIIPYDEDTENERFKLKVLGIMSLRFPEQSIPILEMVSESSVGRYKETVEKILVRAWKRKLENHKK